MNEIEKEEILSISKDLGEVGLDSLLEDGLFKDIPFVGTGISVVKLLHSASDRILLSKIIHFINELELKNEQEIKEFKAKYFKLTDYDRIGSKILLTLERADNLQKIKWLARSLRLFIGNEITKSEFLRLTSIINSAYVEDVLKIVAFDERNEITSNNDIKVEKYVLEHLFSIGLVGNLGINGGAVDRKNSGTIYALNEFGKIMRNKII
ncbi:hypothetical protein KO504_05865 [Winogradskyella psychrotolerans]|uniref:hypothetical protein n=1 Tax=Winogradskyella psychrotolerans TaxID=1344585 RepID=UPI001C07D230|nr:hypothetical protein [Winogradskyella psychrotolerans]MBU2920860.1 hypothetical protein [Winogradskyella psychrotolerans]